MQFKHGAAVRVGERDTYQYLGAGEEIVTLSGTVAPGVTGTLASITQLEAMGLCGQAYVLVDGAGYVYGVYFIQSLETTQRYLFPDGTPRRVDFSLTLCRSDNLPADEPANRTDARG
jgi:phage protein U